MKETMAAVAIALWIHLAIFLVMALMLFWQLLASLVIREEAVAPQEATEVVIAMEQDFSPLVEMAKAEKKVENPEKKLLEELKNPVPTHDPKFVRTTSDQTAGVPEESALSGARDTLARSELGAKRGQVAGPAFSGKIAENGDIQSVDDRFQDGQNEGDLVNAQLGTGQVSDDWETQNETEKMTASEAANGAEEAKNALEEVKMEEFLEPKIVETTLPTPEEIEKREEIEKQIAAQEEKEKQEEAAKKIAGGGAGEFHSEARKTVVLGSLSTSGKAALNVKKTALGRYQQHMFREIERGWQEGNFQYRSHLVPGVVSARFVVDAKGEISGQRRLDMRGASQMQWGLILKALNGAKIPPMPAEVRKELNGQELELSITFNY